MYHVGFDLFDTFRTFRVCDTVGVLSELRNLCTNETLHHDESEEEKSSEDVSSSSSSFQDTARVSIGNAFDANNAKMENDE